MRAHLFRKDAGEPLCEIELEIRPDAAGGLLFEAKLNANLAYLAVDLAGVVVFVTADGTRYETFVQHAFHAPGHGVLLVAILAKPANTMDRHAGCRLFMSEAGHSGFALGTKGDRIGWLYDFFVSPDAETETATKLLELAMSEGAQQLVTYEHPFLELFFLQAGFRTRLRIPRVQLKDPPTDWIPDASASVGCPDFLCMVRSDYVEVTASSMASDLDNFARRPGTTTVGRTCARCGATLPQLRWFGVLEGYHCRECRFLRVSGMLALSPWDRADSISTISRSGASKRPTEGAIFASGADLLSRV